MTINPPCPILHYGQELLVLSWHFCHFLDDIIGIMCTFTRISNVQFTEYLLDSSFFNCVLAAKKCFGSWMLPASLTAILLHWRFDLLLLSLILPTGPTIHHPNILLKSYGSSVWVGITSTGSIDFEQFFQSKRQYYCYSLDTQS